MDPTTVIIILAANLICSGGLFHLIGRRMPQRRGVAYWSAGSIMFGMAYVGRLAQGLSVDAFGAVVLDNAMVLGALLFLAGLREWVGAAPLSWAPLAAIAASYVLLHWLVVSQWAATGRFVLLNVALALIYASIATRSALAARGQASALRPPLMLLTLLMGGLALLTALRGLTVAQSGTATMNSGLAVQIYYAYASLAVVLLGMNLLWMVFVHLNGQLLELATRDALTRVLNRNGLDDALARHFAAREIVPLTLIEVDVDHFKRVNDAFGHAIGDTMLRAVADALASRVRGNDFVARVGGEEFVVGCFGGDMGVALSLGERLRSGVATLRVAGPDGRAQLSCTVSIGVSRSFATLAGRDEAMREADRALYAAKSTGRNRVVAFEHVKPVPQSVAVNEPRIGGPVSGGPAEAAP
jgi:diguanylate cyclase (GGDEF)-like protein